MVSCNIPDVDELHLAECMRACNASAESCLLVGETKLKSCTDSSCRSLVAIDTAHCATDCIDCLTVCVDEAEAVLK